MFKKYEVQKSCAMHKTFIYYNNLIITSVKYTVTTAPTVTISKLFSKYERIRAATAPKTADKRLSEELNILGMINAARTP